MPRRRSLRWKHQLAAPELPSADRTPEFSRGRVLGRQMSLADLWSDPANPGLRAKNRKSDLPLLLQRPQFQRHPRNSLSINMFLGTSRDAHQILTCPGELQAASRDLRDRLHEMEVAGPKLAHTTPVEDQNPARTIFPSQGSSQAATD